jgi:hypothetical protein
VVGLCQVRVRRRASISDLLFLVSFSFFCFFLLGVCYSFSYPAVASAHLTLSLTSQSSPRYRLFFSPCPTLPLSIDGVPLLYPFLSASASMAPLIALLSRYLQRIIYLPAAVFLDAVQFAAF